MPGDLCDADSVTAEVDRIGFGLAQIRVLALAQGIWFVENMQISAAIVTDGARARDLSLDAMQQAALTSMIFFGIMLGGFLGGLLGDSMGRRPPLLLSYFLAASAQFGTAVVQDYSFLCVLRVLLGIAHGVGMPASLAMVSEFSPTPLRVTLGALRQLSFSLGGLVVAVLFCYDSPSYRHLHWSWESALVAVPPLAIGLVAVALLPESPIFLATAGRHAEARAVLRDIRRLNSCREPLETSRSRPLWRGIVASPRSGLTPRPRSCDRKASLDPLSSICGRRESTWIMALIVGALTYNLVGLGHNFAFPHIVESAHSPWLAGYQNLMQNATSLVTGLGVVGLTRILPCRTILIVAGFVGTVGLAIFVHTASMLVRGFQAELLYLVSQNTPMLACALGILAVYQLAVDLFPVRARVISAGVCIAAGRVTAISAPFIFEAFAQWQHFYMLMAGLCCITSALAFMLLPSESGREELLPLHVKKVSTKGKGAHAIPLIPPERKRQGGA